MLNNLLVEGRSTRNTEFNSKRINEIRKILKTDYKELVSNRRPNTFGLGVANDIYDLYFQKHLEDQPVQTKESYESKRLSYKKALEDRLAISQALHDSYVNDLMNKLEYRHSESKAPLKSIILQDKIGDTFHYMDNLIDYLYVKYPNAY